MTQIDRSVLGQIDDLGERLGARPAERPEHVASQTYRVGKASVWPPHILAEIRRIYSGEER